MIFITNIVLYITLTLNTCINSENNTNKQAEALTNFLHEHALQIFGEKIPIKTNCASSSPKWFDANCYRAKRDFKLARNTYNRNRTDTNRIDFVKKRTKYNRVRKRAKQCFMLNEGQRLEKIAKSQPRKFWKSLKNVILSEKTTVVI